MSKFVQSIREEKGITGTDAIIAIIVLTFFVSVISTVIINISSSSEAVKRNSNATSYAVAILEKANKLYYDDITEENLVSGINIPNGYIVNIQISKLSDADPTKEDLVKKITVSVTYKLNKQDTSVSMAYIKAREVLIIPNVPEVRVEENGITTTYIPIKKFLDENNQEYWKVTTVGDSTWYNYENGIWAAAVKQGDVTIQNDIVQNPTDKIYVWIPQYSYKTVNGTTTNVKFLYGLTGKIVNSSNVLEDIAENGYTPTFDETKRGAWYNKSTQTSLSQYSNLNKSIYRITI